MQIRDAFGQVVREIRRAAGLTQEHLAELAGLHATYISLIERGKKSPSIDSIEALGRALSLPGHELVRQAEKIQHFGQEDT